MEKLHENGYTVHYSESIKICFGMSTSALYLVGEGEIITDIPYYWYKLSMPACHKNYLTLGESEDKAMLLLSRSI